MASLALPVVFADTAQAQIAISATALSKSEVILDGDAGCGDRTKLTVKVLQPAGAPETFFGVSAAVSDPKGDDSGYLVPTLSDRRGDYAYYSDWVSLCGFESPGRYRIRVEVAYSDDSGYREAWTDVFFSLKRPSTLSYNAAPEPVKRGGLVTHSGQLKLDPFGPGGLYGAANRTLAVSFARAGTSNYVSKGTIRTGAGGKFSFRLRADADGTWRVSYPANAYWQAQVKGDYVDTF